MIEIKRHENYSENEIKFPCKRGTNEKPCVFCGKVVSDPIYNVRVGLGGMVLISDDAHDALEATGKYFGDVGYFPVDVECWSIHKEAHFYRDGNGPKIDKELAEEMVAG